MLITLINHKLCPIISSVLSSLRGYFSFLNQKRRKRRMSNPFGCPVATSVTITTFSTSPNLLKCRERLSLEAPKWTCINWTVLEWSKIQSNRYKRWLYMKSLGHYIANKNGAWICIFSRSASGIYTCKTKINNYHSIT